MNATINNIIYDRFYELHRQGFEVLNNQEGQAVYHRGVPVWIKLREVSHARSFFCSFLHNCADIPFTEIVIAKEVAHLCLQALMEATAKQYQSREMLSLYLPSDIVLPDVSGILELPHSIDDLMFVMQGINEFREEAFSHVAHTPLNNATATQEAWEEDDDDEKEAKREVIPPLYIWRAGSGKPALAMGLLSTGEANRRLNLIYTPTNERRKGYAYHLTNALCHMARDEGKVPVLYVYEDNVGAVKLYQSLGFTLAGRLTELSEVN